AGNTFYLGSADPEPAAWHEHFSRNEFKGPYSQRGDRGSNASCGTQALPRPRQQRLLEPGAVNRCVQPQRARWSRRKSPEKAETQLPFASLAVNSLTSLRDRSQIAPGSSGCHTEFRPAHARDGRL